jgi:hypothetical protein
VTSVAASELVVANGALDDEVVAGFARRVGLDVQACAALATTNTHAMTLNRLARRLVANQRIDTNALFGSD